MILAEQLILYIPPSIHTLTVVSGHTKCSCISNSQVNVCWSINTLFSQHLNVKLVDSANHSPQTTRFNLYSVINVLSHVAVNNITANHVHSSELSECKLVDKKFAAIFKT